MNLAELSIEQIKTLSAKPDVKRIAVENFLMSVTANADKRCAILNLEMDARLYKWSPETQAAIKEGIQLSATLAKEQAS